MQQLPSDATLQGGKYKILRVLGQGSFGITYLAEHALLARQVAIKEYFPKKICDRDGTTGRVRSSSDANTEEAARFKAKFLKEARNISRLEHRGIIRIHDVFEENGTAYYVMDYLSGGSLDDAIRRGGGLGEAESLAKTMEIGSALAFMHSHRMLHLDLKPANVMLRPDGEAVLIDFGLSKLYGDDGRPETSSNIGGGTAGYAPTEQADYRDGQGFPVTMDIYALGATLFKMLTGTPPPLPSVILNYNFPEEELIARGVSRATRAVIVRAMSPRQADRYQTVEEMMEAVALAGRGEGSASAGTGEETTAGGADEGATVVDAGAGTSGKRTKPGDGSGSGKRKTSKRGRGRNTGSRKNPEPVSRDVSHYSLWLSICVVAIVAVWYFWKPGSSEINGHEYVDLGLSVKWATCNVGAASPSDYGNYYAWGETAQKPDYSSSTSDTYKKSIEDIGGTLKDAARVNWGGSWRLPTKAELKELRNRCTWTWTTQNGNKGYNVRGPNGKSIFLPAAGWCQGTSFKGVGEDGYYWSSAPDESNTLRATRLRFLCGDRNMGWSRRDYGRSIRPVTD